MLKQLKTYLSQCHIVKPSVSQKMYMDISNPEYLISRANEAIAAKDLKLAIQLLNMARYRQDEQTPHTAEETP